MLQNGQFLREQPIKIGAHYVPSFKRPAPTPEELFVQDIELGVPRMSILTKLLAKVLSI